MDKPINNLSSIPSNTQLHVSNEGLEYILKHFDQGCPEKNYFWTTDYKVELPIRVKQSGAGSEQPYTLIEMWQKTVTEYGSKSALSFEIEKNNWKTLSYQEYYEECCKFAKSLIYLNVPEFTAVNIIGFNSAEWAISFYGAMFGHYLPIGIYTTNGPEACEYVANHSEATVIMVENHIHLQKYYSVLHHLKTVQYFVIAKGSVPSDLPADMKGMVFAWAQFMKLGEKVNKEILTARQSAAKPGNCATFIYTSGTTGPPKAVMLSHDNYTWVADSLGRRFQMDHESNQGDKRVLSYLPMSHVAAQLLDLIFSLRFGVHLFFPDASALQGNLGAFLQKSRPTIFLGVPRVWQKMEEKISQALAGVTGLKKYISDWARSISAKGTYAEVNGGELPPRWFLAKKLFFNKIKENLGLDQCKYLVFGAAPMKESTRKFFMDLNLFLINGFGMSQISGTHSLTNPKLWGEFESKEYLAETGQHMDGLETEIYNPDSTGNGQICLRGRNCFMGYFKDEKETKLTVDEKGFLHSGDVGFINAKNCMTITGRIKELIITAGGENVAPVLIENEIFKNLPILSYAVVIGDKKKFLTCLLCLKLANPTDLAADVVEYIKEKGSKAKTIKQALACPIVKQIIEDGIKRANTRAISNAQKIQKFKLLPLEFTIDSGLLTPTMKLKRKIVNTKFEAEISEMYIEAKL